MNEDLSARVELLEQRMEAWEMRFEATAASLRSEISQFREEMHVQLSATRDGLWAEIQREVRAGDEETRRFMRVLHEDLVERISRLGEGAN